MRRYALRKVLLALMAAVYCSEGAAQSVPTKTDSRKLARTQEAPCPVVYGQLPLSFEANQGQADPRVKFFSRGQGYTLFLSRSEAILALRRGQSEKAGTEVEGIGVTLQGANPQAEIVGVEELAGHVNYFIGNDASHWIKNVPTYAKTRYHHIYPGIDLVFYGNEQQLESDFVVAPGGNPNQIRLQFKGGRGLRVSSEGDLILKTSNGEVRLLSPHVYQDVAGSRIDVSGGYLLHGARTVSFSIGAYDHAAPLVIDPILVYSTALNGANFAVGNGGGHGIAVDAGGNAYVTGYTDRSNFLPTPGAFTTANGHLFVTKLNPAGSGVVYTAVFGGTGSDVAMAIALDAQDEPVIAGFTSSADFPTMNPIQATLPAGTHAFVTKLNAAGSSVLYSTLLGGSGATGVGNGVDVANAVATDANGPVYLTGYTNSLDFPTKNGVQPTCPDLQSNGYCNVQGFVAKLDPTQSGSASIIYSTYLGGKFPTAGQGIAVDASGNAYVTGTTNATDFATTPGSFQTTLVGGSDAFVSVLNPGGSSFVYSTFLGYGQGWGIAVDGQGNAYVTGATNAFGGSFPVTAGAFQTTLGGSTTSDHAFVTKLNPSGSALVYSTFLGGSGTENTDTGNIAIDANGNAYIAGLTSSTDFPTTANAIQGTFGGPPYDAFVTELNASGSSQIYSTYLGGAAGDQAYGLALDAAATVYVMGTTSSANFPTTPGAFEPTVNTGTGSVFVARIGVPLTNTTVSASANPSVFGQPVNFTATVSPGGPSALTPTGTVTFSDQGTIVGTATLSSGTAIFNTASLAVGTHSITAAYAGDSNFAPSTSIALTQVVSQAGTTITVSASPSPSILGQPVMLTANVGPLAPGAGTPTGTVTFLDGATVLGTGTLSSAGISTFSTSSLSSGNHSLTASYGGDTDFTASASAPVTLTIQSSAPPPTGPVFVAVNSGGPHIEQYTTTGVFQRSISGGPASNSYTGLAFGADGFLYVANTFVCGLGSCNELEKFDPVAGTWMSSVGSITPNTNPFSGVSNNAVSLDGLALGPGNDLYVTTNQLGLYKIDPAGNITTPITTADCCTFGVAFLPDGTPLSIISSQNAVKNDLTGVSFNTGFFASAQALAFGPDGRLYVLQGHEIDTVPGTGGPFTPLTASNAVSRGSFITFDSQGHIWVTDINFGVLEFDSVAGQQLNAFGSNSASGFEGIAIAPLSAPATHLALSTPASATAATPFSLTVTALDAANNPATGYTGTVNFTSTDLQGALPSNYTFTAADHGTHVFNAVTLNTPGNQTITATDTANAAITGTSAPTNVAVSLTATHFSVATPAAATAGNAFSVTMTALNAANQTSTIYTGTVVFTSTDPQAVLPPTYTFTAADNGTHVFSAVTLNTAGSQTITATDTTNASITGSSPPITVSSPPPPIVQITDNETIKVSDAESFTDAFDAEAVHVADAVFVTPLIAVTAPVAEFSAGGLGFGGQSGTQTISVSDIGGASLTLASATISGGAQFSIAQISCSNGATSISTVLPSGGTCILTINYTASTTPANDTAMLVFNDNAALSNLPSTPSGASYMQSVPLNGGGTNMAPPPPPPAVIAIVDSETIQVTDTESYPDVFDSEAITVSDQVTVKIVSNPTTTSISAAGVTYGTAATATVSVSSLSGTVTGNVTLSVDGGAPSSISLSNGSAFFNLGILRAGSRSLSANFATQGSFSASSAQATLVVNQATPSISWANPAPITYGTALSSTQLNATASVPGSFVYSPAAGTVLPGGIQTLSVVFTPTDTTDYTTAAASVTLIVDAPPVFTSASAATFTVGASSFFTVTATGIPAPVLSDSFSKLPSGVFFDPTTGVLSGTPAQGTGGTYSINFLALNSVGAVLQTFALTVNEAPSITSPSSVTFVVGLAGAFQPTASGFPASTFVESGALPQGLSFAFNALSGTAAEGTEGTYNISFTASNRIGSAVTQKVTLLVIPQSLPAFTSPNNTTFGDTCISGLCVNKLFSSFTVTATGNPIPSLAAAGLPAGVKFKDNGNGTATLSGSPTFGVYHLTLTATGAGGAAFAVTQSFTLNVIQIRTLPAFNSASQAAFVVGQANTFTVAAGPFIDKITMSTANFVPLPSWLVLTDDHDGTATLSGIPQGLPPGYVLKITFTASNTGVPNYSATQTFSLLLVSPGESLPAFTSPNSATFGDSCPFNSSTCVNKLHNSFTVTTTGNPTPSLTAASLPAGVHFTDNHDGTATLSGSPAIGVYHLTFTATGAGGTAFAATQSFTLIVPSSLLIHSAFTSASQAAFAVGQANIFTVAAAPFIDRITMSSANPLPSWLTLVDNHNGTATLNGIPPAAPGQAYNITFTASNSGDPNYGVRQTFSLLLVLPGESLPVFASPSSATFGDSCPFNSSTCVNKLHNSFTINTTGNPTPSLAVAALPAGLHFTDKHNGTATLSGSPAIGVYHLTFTATGAGGTAFAATQSFTLIVPSSLFFHAAFTSASQAAFAVGQANTFTVAAVPFIDRITMSSAPSWLMLTDNRDGTATLSGIPPAAPGQVYNITFTASNSGDPTYKVTQAFLLVLLP